MGETLRTLFKNKAATRSRCVMQTPEQLVELFRRGRITRYAATQDKGWVPGPDAHWARRSPDDMAHTLRGKQSPEKSTLPPLAQRVITARHNPPEPGDDTGNGQSKSGLTNKPWQSLGTSPLAARTAGATDPD